MTKRTFIALPVPITEKLKEETEFYKKNIHGLNVKWVELNNMHLTLAFLGDSSVQQIELVKQGLQEIVPKYQSFNIMLTSAGAFKNLHNPQVLWLGLEIGSILQEIYNETKEMIQAAGFEPENRAFKPHLTIGRVKKFSNTHNLASVISSRESLNEIVIADKIVFYESILMPAGPVYKPIEKYDLRR